MRRHKTVLVSEKLVLQRRKKRLVALYIVSGILTVSLVLLFFVFRAKPLFITHIQVEGNKIIDTSRIEEVINPILDGYYIAVIPKRNRLVYPKEEIEKQLRKDVGRVENLELSVDGHTLKVDISERGSYALWCTEKKDDCYFIDSAGFIFSKAPEFSGGIYQIYEGVVTDKEPLGKQFLDEEMLMFTSEITSMLKEIKLDVERIRVNTLRDTEFVTSRGPVVKLDLTKQATTTKNILKTLFASKDFKDQDKNFSNLDYIDARFGSKIFLKSSKSAQTAASISSF